MAKPSLMPCLRCRGEKQGHGRRLLVHPSRRPLQGWWPGARLLRLPLLSGCRARLPDDVLPG